MNLLKELRSKIILLSTLLVVAGIISLISGIHFYTQQQPVAHEPQAKTLGEQIRAGIAPTPVLSMSTKEKLAHSRGFSALVAYTDQGFEPTEVTVKRGETVRFTNNSSADVWIASKGGNVQIYPRTTDACGSSDFDSCSPFSPQDFWEFTFDVPGDWGVVNNLDKTRSGVVVVK